MPCGAGWPARSCAASSSAASRCARRSCAEKPFYGELVEFITSGPTLALVLEGEGAIATVRTTMGATNPADADPGTIRGDLALSMPDNLVHGSDSAESAAREIALWFD